MPLKEATWIGHLLHEDHLRPQHSSTTRTISDSTRRFFLRHAWIGPSVERRASIRCGRGQYQQNLSTRRISLIVLGSNKWKTVVRRHVEEIIASVSAASTNSYVFIEMPSDNAKSSVRPKR
jgi:hypothetical protein